MIAFALAEHVEHTVDVDGMLERMPAELFNEWCEKDEVVPIGYQTQMLGLIGFLLRHYMKAEDEEVDPNHYMPWLKYFPEPPSGNAHVRQVISSVLGR